MLLFKFVEIALAKPQSARGASHQPAFMGSCLTISHMFLQCIHSGSVSPCVSGDTGESGGT